MKKPQTLGKAVGFEPKQKMMEHFGGKLAGWQVLHTDSAEGGEKLFL